MAQEEIPLTVVIVDDGGYGMLRYDQVRAGARRFGVDLHTPDFAAVAARSASRGDRLRARRRVRRSPRPPRRGPGPVRARRPAPPTPLVPPPNTSPNWYRKR